MSGLRLTSQRPTRRRRDRLGSMPGPSRARELKRYVRFGPADSSRVLAVFPQVAPHFRAISDAFYERIREHEEAHAVFADEAQVERLRGSLVLWFSDLFIGPHDDAHFARAARIGAVHVQVGLPARYMVAAMTLIRDEFWRILSHGGRPEHAASVGLLLDLELAVMLDSYWEHYTRRIRAVAADATAESQRDHDATLDRAPMMIIGLDSDRRIVLFNREAEHTTGYERDEVRGRDFGAALFPEDSEEEVSLAARAVGVPSTDERMAIRTLDALMRTRSGRLRDVRLRFTAGGSSALPILVTATDVTDERALAERTRQAERLAAIGTLAAGLAHEIRNPLNGAHLHLTLLERLLGGARNGEQGEALDAVRTVSHEVRRLSALVTEFLQFARPQPLALRSIELGEVAEHALRVLAPEAARAGIALTGDLPNQRVVVRGDADKLAQVLINLLRNALEAIAEAPSERPHQVVLRLRRQPRTALLEVDDDGPGLPSIDAPIFDAFFSTKSGGTGLGLPIAHRIVTDHGGTLTVEAERGHTIFRILLPISPHDDERSDGDAIPARAADHDDRADHDPHDA